MPGNVSLVVAVQVELGSNDCTRKSRALLEDAAAVPRREPNWGMIRKLPGLIVGWLYAQVLGPCGSGHGGFWLADEPQVTRQNEGGVVPSLNSSPCGAPPLTT